MTLNLYWEPVLSEPHNLGGVPLKWVLVKAFGEHDGSMKEEFILTATALPVLHALHRTHEDAEVQEGIEEVIEAIQAHGTIRLWTDD